jgi:hypothetical protein
MRSSLLLLSLPLVVACHAREVAKDDRGMA